MFQEAAAKVQEEIAGGGKRKRAAKKAPTKSKSVRRNALK